jgi:hypothetical protein
MSEKRDFLALVLLALYIHNDVLQSPLVGMEFIRHYINHYWAS